MKVSAIVPVYNGEAYIRAAVESLLNQSWPCHEIIVVDDGSTDHTVRIVQELQQQYVENAVILIRSQANQGASASRNSGVEQSSGSWILFLDADDVAASELVEAYCRKLISMDKPEEWVLIHSASMQIDSSGQQLGGVNRFKQVDPDEILGYQFLRNHVYLSGAMVNKDAFLRAGGFDTALSYSEDWDLWLRMAEAGGFLYIDDPLFFVRRHGGNVSSSMNNMLEGERHVLGKYSLQQIQQAIFRRKLPIEENACEYVAMLFRLGLWEEGYSRIEEIASGNRMPNLSFLRGLYMLHHRRLQEARASFVQVIESAPQHGAALNNAGALALLSGERDLAETLFEQAVAAFPGYVDAMHNLAIIGRAAIGFEDCRFTWRSLRSNLTRYTS